MSSSSLWTESAGVMGSVGVSSSAFAGVSAAWRSESTRRISRSIERWRSGAFPWSPSPNENAIESPDSAVSAHSCRTALKTSSSRLRFT